MLIALIAWHHYTGMHEYCAVSRAGLKPMQPMQLHWAQLLWGPRAMVFRKVVHFCQILLELENSVETAYKSHY